MLWISQSRDSSYILRGTIYVILHLCDAGNNARIDLHRYQINKMKTDAQNR